eukprot:TRINITY_DN6498_c0_g1_i1.p1 TRINITY_DN6498_c0_g1~~TRINITY_DN6498_c0_g1_i1.p1  ORF type:complete len:721 (-),score=187.11 TRINITY_DN6498_c0_g1_i1:6-1979(-)
MTELVNKKEPGNVIRLWDLWQEKEGDSSHPVMYAQAIRAYNDLRQLEKPIELYEALQSAGIRPGPILLRPLIENAILRRKPSEAKKFWDMLLEQDVDVRPGLMLRMLYVFKDLGEHKEIVAIYEKLKTQPDTVIDQTCKKIIDDSLRALGKAVEKSGKKDVDFEISKFWSFVKHERSDNARMLFYKLLDSKAQLPEDMYAKALELSVEAQKYEQASALYRQICDKGFEITIDIVHNMIKAYVALEKAKLAWDLFSGMKDMGLTPNADTYKIMVSHARLRKNSDNAETYFGNILMFGTIPDPETYLEMIQLYADLGEAREARNYLDQLIKLGKADVSAYNVLFGCYGGKRYQQAEALYQEMVSKQVSPNVQTFEIFIRNFVEAKKPQLAAQYLEKMSEFGIEPSEKVYEALLEMYCILGDEAQATRVFEEMKACGKASKTATAYNHLLDLYSTKGNSAKFEEVHQFLGKTNVRSSGDTFATMIVMYAKEGKIKEVEELYQQVLSKKVPLTAKMLSAMAAMYAKAGDEKKANVMSETMAKNGFKPTDDLYNGLVEMNFSDKNYDKVEELFNKMEAEGIVPDARVHELMIRVWLIREEWKEADILFKSMAQKGLTPNADTFNTLIDVNLEQGMRGRAQAIEQQMEAKGIKRVLKEEAQKE